MTVEWNCSGPQRRMCLEHEVAATAGGQAQAEAPQALLWACCWTPPPAVPCRCRTTCRARLSPTTTKGHQPRGGGAVVPQSPFWTPTSRWNKSQYGPTSCTQSQKAAQGQHLVNNGEFLLSPPWTGGFLHSGRCNTQDPACYRKGRQQLFVLVCLPPPFALWLTEDDMMDGHRTCLGSFQGSANGQLRLQTVQCA